MNLPFAKSSRLSSLLGLSLDGSRLEGVVLRRNNGAFSALNKFSAVLSLDPLTNDPELVGREIRNHLDAAEVRERQCVFGLPLKWALATTIELPALPEADVAGFLALEAERAFPCDVSTLRLGTSRTHVASGREQALMVGIPNNHLARIEQVLRAARLSPVSFALAINALQSPADKQGVLALAIGENQVALQVTSAGGIAALRALEGALEIEGTRRELRADAIAREVRITLGQMPPELQQGVRAVRVFGPADLARQLADLLEMRFETSGLEAEAVTKYGADAFGAQLPPHTEVSPAFSLAARHLAGQPAPLEFLPPRVSAIQQLAARYASGKYRSAIMAASAVAVIVGGLFFYQQLRLWNLQKEWKAMSGRVAELNDFQDKILQYNPWSDQSVRAMTILRGLTQAFPEDGAVTAKTVEVRDLNNVVCTGLARTYQDLLQTVQKLRGMPQIREVNLGPTRGQSPALQFSFNFVWNDGGSSAN